jgi:Fe-S cluster assembly iron-binding protein IscA
LLAKNKVAYLEFANLQACLGALQDFCFKKGGIMLTVTAQAAEKLKEAIQTQTTDPEVAIRLIPSTTRPNQLDMALDKEKEGDQVVESEGVKVLIVSSELAEVLDGMVIDCQETPEGVHFSMSKLAPDA